MSRPSKQALDEALMNAAKEGDVKKIGWALKRGANPRMGDEALKIVSARGFFDCAEFLVNNFPIDAKTEFSNAIKNAAANGHTSIVELLLPISEPYDPNCDALFWAAVKGHADCCAILSKNATKKKLLQEPLEMAAAKGHVDCVKTILSFMGGKCGHVALAEAAVGGSQECILAIMPCTDIDKAIKEINKTHTNDPEKAQKALLSIKTAMETKSLFEKTLLGETISSFGRRRTNNP